MFKKAFTLSYDDGVWQDRRFVYLINKYNLKCTFNLNSGRIMKAEENGGTTCWRSKSANNVLSVRMMRSDMEGLYTGHEIAVHGLEHINITEASFEETKFEFSEDKKNLEEFFNVKIEGAAYAYGTTNEYAPDILKSEGIKYSRGTKITENFDPWENMYDYRATCHHASEKLFDLAHEFIELEAEKPQIFYVWGHTYEFDADEAMWERIEEFFKLISNRDDIFYGTNIEVFKYFNLI